MIYRQEPPGSGLQNIIKSYWMADSQGSSYQREEKIIPDGYPEIIFHYKDPYEINFGNGWEVQATTLLAGQIRNHFYLRNTGESGVLGIKMQPWALKNLFGLQMNTITDKVIPLPSAVSKQLQPIALIAVSDIPFVNKVQRMDAWWGDFLAGSKLRKSRGEKAVRFLLERQGEMSGAELLEVAQISERSLERYFSAYIGLSPKFYSRIIRFSRIFKLVEQPGFKWVDIAFIAGYYDQSHFIKNFKEFTGEEPSRYAFDQENLASMFLR